MRHLGIDLGTSTVKLVLTEGEMIDRTWIMPHHGRIPETLKKGVSELGDIGQAKIAVTGSNAQVLLSRVPEIEHFRDIPAVVEGVRHLHPEAGSIIDIGSQGARFITEVQEQAPRFAVNEHCAGGTGSFFEDQMSRLSLRMEDYSRLCGQADSIPRLSGRCAVFAKTDIIHRQQEGESIPNILLGLCYAMIRNYKATIVRDLPIQRPVVFTGGVTQNQGVICAIRDIFHLKEEELIVPEYARFAAAVGAALHASTPVMLSGLLSALETCSDTNGESRLEPLKLLPGTHLQDPVPVTVIPASGCALGIDIGSTSTNLVLTTEDGSILDLQYLRTAGDPEGAVRRGLESIRSRFGEVEFRAVGVTGSGRERIGAMLGADLVRDEITAQAKAAVHHFPDADTVFEIGGQDSKYISLKNGQVADFRMNKICAAGTGSFVEEQAARMNIPIQEFGPLALTGTAPAELGERCTVFIETSIAAATAANVSQANIAAGLCHSIIRNYLTKVVGAKPVGKRIVLQGGVAYNPGIVAAFQAAFGERIAVSPCFSISGAYGVSLLALEAMGEKKSHFKGYDFSGEEDSDTEAAPSAAKNMEFYQKAGQLLLAGYDGRIDPKKKTVGVPYVLVMHKFFPMVNAFFKSLGFNVLLSRPTDEDTIHIAQQYASGETCYPVKLIWGHMAQLVEQKVDYIFLPRVHTMKHEVSHVEHNYGCVYMQTAPQLVARSLKLEERGIRLLSPVFDLDFGKEAMGSAMLSVGKELGIPKPLCAKALLSGAMAVRKHTEQVEQQGKALLSSLKPEDKVLVLVTRNYGISDPVLNMGIPKLLLQRGYKVITLSHLPAHDLDLSQDYPNLYWPFGQHILSGIKMIARHPNLYAVYLTNHGCGPDSMLSHMVQREMGEKPYLQIEVDEHFSKVGVITRIEAFLNSLSHRPVQPLPADFDIKAVDHQTPALYDQPLKDTPLYIPDLGWYTRYLAEAIRQNSGVDVLLCPPVDRETLLKGRAETNSKEYLPFPALLGSILQVMEKKPEGAAQFLIPATLGSEADGQYAQAIRAILDRKGHADKAIIAPILERLPERSRNIDLLWRALLTGDLLYAAPTQLREELAPKQVPSQEELLELARKIGSLPTSEKALSAVGTPLCLTVLHEGVMDTLEQDGFTLLRAPLSEHLWFLWQSNCKEKAVLNVLGKMREDMTELSHLLGDRTPYSDTEALYAEANAALPSFDGGNGRYRWAKAVALSQKTRAILSFAPRYENTEMILQLTGLPSACKAPLLQVALDGDWDEAAWTRLRSFLYYC